MRKFRSDTKNDGMMAFIPTIIYRSCIGLYSIGLWWGPWCIDLGWWKRERKKGVNGKT